MNIFLRLRLIFGGLYSEILRALSPIIVERFYGGFWDFRNKYVTKESCCKTHQIIYRHYLNKFGSYVGPDAKISSIPTFPHNLNGIFISNMSEIGKNVVIFQQVTIGSNLIEGHPRHGAPTIGDNVYIGAGAKIIGNVKIGNNCRIGANCVVVKDMPPNTTAVASPTRYIESEIEMNNRFISYCCKNNKNV